MSRSTCIGRPCWGLVLLLAAMLPAGCTNPDREKGYLLRHAPVSLSQAAKIAEGQVPGRAVRVELTQTGNRVFYEVEIVDVFNKSRHVRVDAETGKVM
ncbi:MAG TPA: PepSY domain-containing protein [Nitrospira sp.]|nr:PepSY domain-containing protein [Nitrospira sp.]